MIASLSSESFLIADIQLQDQFDVSLENGYSGMNNAVIACMARVAIAGRAVEEWSQSVPESIERYTWSYPDKYTYASQVQSHLLNNKSLQERLAYASLSGSTGVYSPDDFVRYVLSRPIDSLR